MQHLKTLNFYKDNDGSILEQTIYSTAPTAGCCMTKIITQKEYERKTNESKTIVRSKLK